MKTNINQLEKREFYIYNSYYKYYYLSFKNINVNNSFDVFNNNLDFFNTPSELFLLWIIRDFFKILKYIKRIEYQHLDIKPQNLMLNDNYEIKLIDSQLNQSVPNKKYEEIINHGTKAIRGILLFNFITCNSLHLNNKVIESNIKFAKNEDENSSQNDTASSDDYIYNTENFEKQLSYHLYCLNQTSPQFKQLVIDLSNSNKSKFISIIKDIELKNKNWLSTNYIKIDNLKKMYSARHLSFDNKEDSQQLMFKNKYLVELNKLQFFKQKSKYRVLLAFKNRKPNKL